MNWFKKIFGTRDNEVLIYEEKGEYRIMYNKRTGKYSTEITGKNDFTLEIYKRSLLKLEEIQSTAN